MPLIIISNEVEDVSFSENRNKKSLSIKSSESKKQIQFLLENDENFRHDWDEEYGDKLIKLVFIGQNLDKESIVRDLDQI